MQLQAVLKCAVEHMVYTACFANETLLSDDAYTYPPSILYKNKWSILIVCWWCVLGCGYWTNNFQFLQSKKLALSARNLILYKFRKFSGYGYGSNFYYKINSLILWDSAKIADKTDKLQTNLILRLKWGSLTTHICTATLRKIVQMRKIANKLRQKTWYFLLYFINSLHFSLAMKLH